jgi:hypothetical protein
VYASDTAPVALVDADGVSTGLATALTEVFRLDPRTAFDAYEGVVAHGDGECPTYDPQHTFQDYWEDECVTTDGSSFDGWVLSQHDRNTSFPDQRCTDFGFYFGFCRVSDPAGEAWDGWGQLTWSECQELSTGDLTRSGDYRGNFRFEGGDPSWLEDPLYLNLDVSARHGAAGRSVTIAGGLSGLTGDLPAVWFDDFVVSDGSACPAEPSGAIKAWDLDDVAYEVTFDGPDDPACDGCGALTIDGVDAGEACVDTAPLLAWEDRPWE